MITRLFFLVALLALAFAAPAQQLKPGEWRTYTAMTNVADILITPDSNNVWVTTSGGIYRVPISDVSEANSLQLRNSDGLRDNNCSALARDAAGDLIIGDSSGGITIYRPKTAAFDIITDIASSAQFPHRQIAKLTIDDSLLYIATGFGLSIYNLNTASFDETVTRFGVLTPQDTVFDVEVIGGTIYTVLSNAIAYAPKNSALLSAPFEWKTIRAPFGANLRTLGAFGDRIVVGSMQGLWQLESDSLKFIPTPDSIAAIRLVVSPSGRDLFVLDARGNTLLRTSDLANFSSEALVRNANQKIATAFAVAPNGDRVSGFSDGGITIVRGVTPQVGFAPAGPLNNEVLDLSFSQSTRTLYSAYGDYGLAAFEPATSRWTAYPTSTNTLPRTSWRSCLYDSLRSVLWAATYGDGAYAITLAPSFSIQHFQTASGLPSSDASGNDFIITDHPSLDNKGNVLMPVWGQSGEGLAISSDGQTFHGVQLNPPTPSFRPFGHAVQDMDNYYFVGTESQEVPAPYGVAVVHPDGTIEHLIGGNGGQLASETINAMLVDQDNGLWCGTNVGVQVVSHSLSFQTNATQFHARTLKFLDQQIVRAMDVDAVGNKWVGTQDGVFVVSPDGTDSLAHYTKANSPLIDDNISSIATDKRTGEVYIATSKGISRTSSVFKQGEVDYANLTIYPNPIVQNGDDPVSVTFTGLKQGSSLLVLTPAGRRVATIDASSFGSTVRWDCRDENRKLLPSGVYLVGATTTEDPEFGMTKIVLVRK